MRRAIHITRMAHGSIAAVLCCCLIILSASGAAADDVKTLECNQTVMDTLLKGKPIIDPTGKVLTSWNSSECYCHWDSVTCATDTSTLKSLSFGAGLEGVLPAAWGALDTLEFLYISHNNVTGTLPPEWAGMASLTELDLGVNKLDGPLPEAWSAMTALQRLGLINNGFAGTLPSSWSALTSLYWLALEGSKLEGSLPAQWSAMKSMQLMTLSRNSLTGQLPQEWSAMAAASRIELRGNKLTGQVPASWGKGMSNLTSIALDSNDLSGTLPAEWSAMTELRMINVSSNPKMNVSAASIKALWPGLYPSADGASASTVRPPAQKCMVHSIEFGTANGTKVCTTSDAYKVESILGAVPFETEQYTYDVYLRHLVHIETTCPQYGSNQTACEQKAYEYCTFAAESCTSGADKLAEDVFGSCFKQKQPFPRLSPCAVRQMEIEGKSPLKVLEALANAGSVLAERLLPIEAECVARPLDKCEV